MSRLEFTNGQLDLIERCIKYNLMMAKGSGITWSAADQDCDVEDHIDNLEKLLSAISDTRWMFALKLEDCKYSCFGYITKSSILVSTSGFFYDESSLFASAEEAMDYIDTFLEAGLFRPDITRGNFSVVGVRRYSGCGSAYLTEDAYARMLEEDV